MIRAALFALALTACVTDVELRRPNDGGGTLPDAPDIGDRIEPVDGPNISDAQDIDAGLLDAPSD